MLLSQFNNYIYYFFILLLFIFNSCSSEKNVSISNKSTLTPQPSVEEPQGNSPIEVNRLKWKQNKLNIYQFQFQWQCFCTPDYVVPVLVTVNRGAITKVVDAKSGQPVSVNRYKNYLTMGGLFDFVQSAIDENAIQIDANYHPKYGFPTKVWIDWNRMIADEEKGFLITELKQKGNIIWQQAKQ